MKRPYQDTTSQVSVSFFVGTEVEHTPAHNARTLFVVGIQPVAQVIAHASTSEVEQIYLGANQSFDPGNWAAGDHCQSDKWARFIDDVFDNWSKWLALDFDLVHLNWVLDSGWCENNNFIPMISVKLPYIRQLNVNAVLKLDDRDFAATNPGVWCHMVSDLTHSSKFTHWNSYTKDQIL